MADKSNRMHKKSTYKPIKIKSVDNDGLMIIGSRNSIPKDCPEQEDSDISQDHSYPSQGVRKHYEIEDSDEIEEMQLTPISLLQQAAEFSDPTFYYQALTFDAEKQALEERANQLQHRLEIELRIKSRKLASRYYGWTDVPWTIPLDKNQMNLNDMWGALRSSSDHEYALQDPNISKDFFNNLRQMMVSDDLESMQGRWGYEYQVQDYFPEYPSVIYNLLM